jgi:hypothetical protein
MKKNIEIKQITAGQLMLWDDDAEQEGKVPALFALCADGCVYVREAYTAGGEWELLAIPPTE